MKKNLLLLILVIISISFGMQHIIGLARNQHYTPFAFVGVSKGGSLDEAYCYVPQVNSASFGKPLGDWQVWEYRHYPKVQPILGPVIFGRLVKLMGLENLYITVDFIFPPLVFLAFYALAKLIIKNDLLSVLAALLLLGYWALEEFIFKFGVSIFKYHDLEYFAQYLQSLNRPLQFARFDNPQFSFLVLAAGLIFFWLGQARKNLYDIGTGIFFGLTWYVYSYWAIFTVLSLVFSRRFKALAIQLAIAGVYFLNYRKFLSLPQSEDFLVRAGLQAGRFLDPGSYLLLLIIFVIFYMFRKTKRKEYIFLLYLNSSVLAAINLQLVTGFSIQHFHWASAVGFPVMILSLVYLAKPILRKVTLLLIPALLLSIFFRNFLIASNTAGAYTRDLKREEAMTWINNNLEDDAVVATPSIESNYWLIAKTKVYIYAPHGLHSLASTDELAARMAFVFDLYGLTQNEFANFVSFSASEGRTAHTSQSLNASGYGYLYYLKYGFDGPGQDWQPNAKNQNTYKLDYLFVGPWERSVAKKDFTKDENLIKVFDNSNYQLYRKKNVV